MPRSRATSASTATKVSSSLSVRASSNSSPLSVRPLCSVVSVPTTPSSSFFSRPSSCARSGLSQTFGSSSSRSTDARRSAFTSKSKIPPKLARAILEIGERIGEGIDVFGFHGDPGWREAIGDYSVRNAKSLSGRFLFRTDSPRAGACRAVAA